MSDHLVKKSDLSEAPIEVQMKICTLLNAGDIQSLAKSSLYFSHFVKRHQKYLAREKRHLDLDLATKECRVRRESSSNTVVAQCSLEECSELLDEIEVTTLTVQGPSEDCKSLNRLITSLNEARQFKIKSFHMRKVELKDRMVCERLYQLLANGNCLAITLEECRLACGFSSTQVNQMEDLCQFTVKDCSPPNGMGLLTRYLSKLAADMRFKPKSSMPFYAEAPELKASELCQFIKTWIHISEAPFFQIYVTNCDRDFYREFLDECNVTALSHLHLQFNSKVHRTAHIQAQFDEERGRFQMHPIFDVPAVGPTGYCRARYYRDI